VIFLGGGSRCATVASGSGGVWILGILLSLWWRRRK